MSVTVGQILASEPFAATRKEVLADTSGAAVREVRHGAANAAPDVMVVAGPDDGELEDAPDLRPAALLIAADAAAWSPSAGLARAAEERGVGIVVVDAQDSWTLHAWAAVALAQAEAARSRELERFATRLLDELRTGAGLSGLMNAAALILDAPVVLATTERRIVAVAGLSPDADPSSVLRAAAESVPLTVAGQPWGGLSTTATGSSGGASVDELLRRLASVAELELLRSSETLAPEQRARQELLKDLLAGRSHGLEQRASMLGMQIADGAALIALAATRAGVAPEGVERAVRRHGLTGVWSTLDEDVLLLAKAPPGSDATATAQQVAASIVDVATAVDKTVVAVGPAAGRTADAGRILSEARRTLAIARSGGDTRPIVTTEMLLVDRVLAPLVQVPEVVQTFEELLGPLRTLPAPRRRALTDTLHAYLESGGSKTATAHRLRIRRQSLYTRLEHLDELIGPLADPERRLALQLATRTVRLTGADDLADPLGRA